jgi:hypothetical protein
MALLNRWDLIKYKTSLIQDPIKVIEYEQELKIEETLKIKSQQAKEIYEKIKKYLSSLCIHLMAENPSNDTNAKDILQKVEKLISNVDKFTNDPSEKELFESLLETTFQLANDCIATIRCKRQILPLIEAKQDKEIVDNVLHDYTEETMFKDERFIAETKTFLIVWNTQILKKEISDHFLSLANSRRLTNEIIGEMEQLVQEIIKLNIDEVEKSLYQEIFSRVKAEFESNAEFHLQQHQQGKEESRQSGLSRSGESRISFRSKNDIVKPIQRIAINKKKSVRELLLSQLMDAENIPAILVVMHGSIRYNKDNDCAKVITPFRVLYRLIFSAPYQENLQNAKAIIHHMKKNVKKGMSIKELFDLFLSLSQSFDKNKFPRYLEHLKEAYTNFNHQDRKHVLINYGGTEICDKSFINKPNKSKLLVLNETTRLKKDTDLLQDSDFIAYIRDQKETKMEIDPETRQEYVKRFKTIDLYKYLYYQLQYKQAVIVDNSCETNNYEPFKDQFHKDVEQLEKYLDIDEETAETLYKVMETKWLATDNNYKVRKQNALQNLKTVRRKAKRHYATVITKRNNNRGTR